ncbi:MAG: SAM hydrolase/SAM-dependent halogenase family protein, partial [Acidimicrobiia bacterium]
MGLPVSFLSDFGLLDEYVGVVHGVIYRVSPGSRVIDITHAIPAGDVRAGALALTRAVQYLPSGVVLALVDPGVGTSRMALAAETEAGFFVGPDNGLLSPAVAMVGGARAIHAIENPEVIIPGPGSTFQGRDVFAPAAGLLAAGEAQLGDLGPAVDPSSVMPLMLPLPKTEPPMVTGEAWWVDVYGNVETNIGPEELMMTGARPGTVVQVRIGASMHEARWVKAFADVDEGALALHVDSAGLMALAVRGARA